MKRIMFQAMKHTETHLPRIWLIGFSQAGFLPEVLAEYSGRADANTR